MSNYYDIDSILAECENINVTFQVDAFELGYLKPTQSSLLDSSIEEIGESSSDEESSKDEIASEDSDDESLDMKKSKSSSNQDLKKDTKVLLPLWLANVLGTRNFVELELPVHYGQKFLKSLEADADHVNLAVHSPYYYEIGIQLATLLEDPEDGVEMLRDALVKCFVKRLPKIYANSNNVVKETMSKYMSILTKSEQQLYEGGRKGAEDFCQWKNVLIGHSITKKSDALTEDQDEEKRGRKKAMNRNGTATVTEY